MATSGLVTRTEWDGATLRIHHESGVHELPASIRWTVGEDVDPAFQEIPPCVFEPICLRDGTPCKCPIGAKPHVVYAAFYGTLAKVGLTSARRIASRLREQGADAGFVIARCPDRGAARMMEKDLSFLHRIPEWRTHKEKFPLLARPVPWKGIDEQAEIWHRRFGLEGKPDLMRFDHPLPVLERRPHLVKPAGTHDGTIIGAKGPYLFYAPRSAAGRLDVGKKPVLALKHTELIGRDVAMD